MFLFPVLSLLLSLQCLSQPTHELRNSHLLQTLQPPRLIRSTSREIVEIVLENDPKHRISCQLTPSGRPLTPPAPPLKPHTPLDPSLLQSRLSSLKGVCLTHEGGWWRTTWCFSQTVRQSHSEGQRETLTYSLGDYRSGEVRLAGGGGPGRSERAIFYAETFADGQACEETGEKRRTEVRLYCCPKDKTLTLVGLQETTLCSYTMTVCWANLCDSGLAPLSSAGRDSWASLRSLTGLCFRTRGDGSNRPVHEFCFEKWVRSFKHSIAPVATIVMAGVVKKSAQPRIVEADVISLGRFDPELTLKGEEEGVEEEGKKERVAVQVYAAGDSCPVLGDDEPKFYYSHVKLGCFLTRSAAPEIVSVRAVSRCGVILLFHTPGLCDDDDERKRRLRSRQRRNNGGAAATSSTRRRMDDTSSHGDESEDEEDLAESDQLQCTKEELEPEPGPVQVPAQV